MASTPSPCRSEILEEVDKIPSEYLPALLKIMRAFRGGVMLPNAGDSFRQGWQEAIEGQTHPASELWEDVDAE